MIFHTRTIVKIIAFLAVIIYETYGETLKIVETPKGKLEGLSLLSRNGRKYNAFRGIPYAEKPERFSIAKPHPNWTGIKKATEFGMCCPHFDLNSKTIIGDDDCLFLNVFSPELSENSKKLPVMVWFYPGGFEVGRSDDFDAKYFMDTDIILVTLNYRIGALGFLSTGDHVVTGNMGLKDQNLALKWVQENIEAFGGNSKSVTIFGESAGGASVNYHILSKSSKDLFINAISQSGSALCPWALQQNPQPNADRLGSYLNCPSETSEELIDCIKTKSSKQIVAAQMRFNRWAIFPFNTFAPVVESEESNNAFLTETPYKLMSSGRFNKVPWITGYTEDEGSFLSTSIILNENFTKAMNEEWSRVAPIALLYDHIANQERKDEISEKILNMYFENDDIGEESWDSLTNLFSDRYFVYPINKAATFHAKYAPVFPYEFAFAGGEPTFLRIMLGVNGEYGVGHGDDLQYLFNGAYGSPEYIDETKHETFEFSHKFVKMWTSFAENSVPPFVEWKSISNVHGNLSIIPYYQIASQNKISDTDLEDRIAFWNDLMVDGTELAIRNSAVTKDEL